METRSQQGIPWLKFGACGVVAVALLIGLSLVETGGQNVARQDVSGDGLTISGEVPIEKDLTVPEDSTLVIEPGARLRMGNDTRIFVKGRIIAKGTEDKPIIFEGIDKDVYWRGIKIEGFDDVKPDDVIEAFTVEKIARTL